MNFLLEVLTFPLSVFMWCLEVIVVKILNYYADALAMSRPVRRRFHRVVRWLLCLVDGVLWLRTGLAPLGPRRTVPPSSEPLLNTSAVKLAHAIRHRKMKSEDLVAAYIKRVKEVNPIINCVVEERFADAIKEARIVDKLLTDSADADYWAKHKPLLGVPITIKESIAVKGMSNNAARSRVAARRATQDAECVSLVRRAGAIPLLVSNTPELCINFESFNRVTGTSCNPYDTRRTTGGSSGGEAGLLGAGASVLGLGSDLAGSIRLPAFFCGIFGHKPSSGFVALGGHMPESSDTEVWEKIFAIGPMCRYAEDLPVSLAAIIPDRNRPHLLALDKPVDLSKVKVYWLDRLGPDSSLSQPVGKEMRQVLDKAAAHFRSAHSAPVEQVRLREADDIMAVGVTIVANLKGVDNVFQKTDDNCDDWGSVPLTLVNGWMAGRPSSAMAASYGPGAALFSRVSQHNQHKLEAKRVRLQRQIEERLGEDGILLVPSCPVPAPYHYRNSFTFYRFSYMFLFNMTELPSTQCPLGFNSDGIPLGLQVVASRRMDRLCFAAAASLEKAFGGWKPVATTR